MNEDDAALGALMRAARPDEPEAPDFSRMLARARYEVREQESSGVPSLALVAAALLALGFALVYQMERRADPEAPPSIRSVGEVVEVEAVHERLAAEDRDPLQRQSHEAHDATSWEAPTDFLLAGPLEEDLGLMSDSPNFGEAAL